MRLIASLPWYDLPPARDGLNAFWEVLRGELKHIGALPLPPALERDMPLIDQWAHAGLLLSQCCGPDLFTPAARHLEPIARPVFMDLDCNPGDYYSHIVTTNRLLPTRPRLVVNAPSSRSGCAALYEWLRRQRVEPGSVLISGAHAQSLEWLRHGRADVAAIDAHSWPLLNTQGLHIIGRSEPAPSPPFVMHRGAPVTRQCMHAALIATIAKAGEAIGIAGVQPAERESYSPIVHDPATQAVGCATLC